MTQTGKQVFTIIPNYILKNKIKSSNEGKINSHEIHLNYLCLMETQLQFLEKEKSTITKKRRKKRKRTLKINYEKKPTFSNFSKLSALSGNQPWMASPATALSQAGQPAATCSPSTYFCKFPSLKLTD